MTCLWVAEATPGAHRGIGAQLRRREGAEEPKRAGDGAARVMLPAGGQAAQPPWGTRLTRPCSHQGRKRARFIASMLRRAPGETQDAKSQPRRDASALTGRPSPPPPTGHRLVPARVASDGAAVTFACGRVRPVSVLQAHVLESPCRGTGRAHGRAAVPYPCRRRTGGCLELGARPRSPAVPWMGRTLRPDGGARAAARLQRSPGDRGGHAWTWPVPGPALQRAPLRVGHPRGRGHVRRVCGRGCALSGRGQHRHRVRRGAPSTASRLLRTAAGLSGLLDPVLRDAGCKPSTVGTYARTLRAAHRHLLRSAPPEDPRRQDGGGSPHLP
ncbi:General secretion pathway protein N [Hyalangium minutum]|uniref:General secretion pathway protein N n=1 Tax=Hyalangium minutum TaxID=394096 RepID=A0A085WWD2_9BACT|nr:General secretion pathway protein N [Hyalangium minutum]